MRAGSSRGGVGADGARAGVEFRGAGAVGARLPCAGAGGLGAAGLGAEAESPPLAVGAAGSPLGGATGSP